ncbi:MAG: DUF5103 domain-containing protein [Catalinimonas sp.]
MRPIFIFPGALLLLLVGCVPVAQQGGSNRATDYYSEKRLRFRNYVYEEAIQTPLLYPADPERTNIRGDTDPRRMLEDPVLMLGTPEALRLEFDELGDQYQNYFVKLIHCNGDWKKSLLNDIEFLFEYNRFLIDDYEISINTRLPYIHYRFTVPPVKVSGNYLVVVYRESDERDVILTRRFVVYENELSIQPEVRFSTGIAERPTHQQVDFQVFYPQMNLINPQLNMRAVVRQNGRWDNALDLKPLFFDPNERRLDYRYFDLENNFRGGNEYRNADLRSIRFQGQGVGRVQRADDRVDLYLNPDAVRRQTVYTQLIDINGRFVIENFEQERGAGEADYVYTHFSVRTPPVEGDVYVFGQLTGWDTSDEARMQYVPERNAYETTLLLKQGFYNYLYAIRRPDGTLDEQHFEGSYNITENEYEIIMYYRDPTTRADRVVGYTSLKYFGRN